MIAYLDTSALIKLYIKEEGSEEVQEIIKKADSVATSKVAYVESRAAMSRLLRENAFDEIDYQGVKKSFQKDWSKFVVVELTDTVISKGAELTEKYILRGFEAIHLASALILKTQVAQNVISGCWDIRLWDAFKDNMDVFPTKWGIG